MFSKTTHLKIFPAAGVISVVLMLVGCSSRSPAPIYDRSSNPYRKAAQSTTRIVRPSNYDVRKGDTLYAIAWRFGIDHRSLAAWNGISSPYLIYPDQKLRLSKPRQVAVTMPLKSDSTEIPRKPGPERKVDNKPLAPGKPPSNATGQSKSAPVVVSPAPSVSSPPQKVPAPAATSISWGWPAEGDLLMRFSNDRSGYNGIDIGGRRGQQIKAAASGEVVYSGVGLVGYGDLVIIKHDEQYLSAYGHNRKRLVKEGDRVRAGQKIAEMGDTGTDRYKLHFEIRRNGKPVDPLKYLSVQKK